MTVVVSFITGGQITAGASGVKSIRKQERITIPGTTSTATQVGETVLIGNGETSMIAVAFGSAPDAAATDASATTSAGMPIGAGMVGVPIVPGAGNLINIKAVP
jgi:hypothetical protein